MEEAEKLRHSLVEVEKKAREPEQLRRDHEDLERVYASLQHQYQVSLWCWDQPRTSKTIVCCFR